MAELSWSCAGSLVATAGLLLVAAAGCKRDAGSSAGLPEADGGAGERTGSGNRSAGKAAERTAAAPRQPEVVQLTGVAIRWAEPVRQLPIRDEELARRLGALLTRSPAFLASGEPAPAGRVVVPAAVNVTLHHDVVDARRGGKSGGRRMVVVGVEEELDWKVDGERLEARENVLIERPLERREAARVESVVAELVAQAVDEAGRGLVAKETLRQASDEQVLAALRADDTDAALWALDLVADRRIAAGFDRAVELFDARDPGVRGAALRALVALRDPRAVPLLARKADFADPETMRALVEAVTAIGGTEAIDFLEMIAGGHADPDMRARAVEGLERLGRRHERRDP